MTTETELKKALERLWWLYATFSITKVAALDEDVAEALRIVLADYKSRGFG